MDEVLTHIVTAGGPVGIVLVLLYMYIRQLQNELREVHQKRVEDNQAMVTKLLELNDKWNETINAQIEADEASRSAADAQRFAQDHFIQEMKMVLLESGAPRRR